MSATQIDMKFSAVVEKPEMQPPWIVALCELTGRTADDIIKTMVEAEMYNAGTQFIEKFPDLFRGGLS